MRRPQGAVGFFKQNHTVRLWTMAVDTFTSYCYSCFPHSFSLYSNMILKASSLNCWILYKGIFLISLKVSNYNCKRKMRKIWVRFFFDFCVCVCVSLFDLHPFWVISYCVPSKFSYSARYFNCLLQIFQSKLFM